VPISPKGVFRIKGVLNDPDDPSCTYEAFAFETVRVKDGKFTEHWDQVTLAPGWLKVLERSSTLSSQYRIPRT
jgi:predicted SnoaL-like aldol condensation-catalyzing enzyme